MKPEIHPKYHEVDARCACGATWKTRSTKPELHLEICSQLPPVLHGPAEADRHRGPRRAVHEEVRRPDRRGPQGRDQGAQGREGEEDRSRREVSRDTPCGVGAMAPAPAFPPPQFQSESMPAPAELRPCLRRRRASRVPDSSCSARARASRSDCSAKRRARSRSRDAVLVVDRERLERLAPERRSDSRRSRVSASQCAAASA